MDLLHILYLQKGVVFSFLCGKLNGTYDIIICLSKWWFWNLW